MEAVVPVAENPEATRLATLEGKVAMLVADKKPWYKDIGNLISVFAFALSLGTFAYSSQRELNKDKAAKTTELQSTIAQLNALTEQWAELYVKYKDNPDYSAFLVPTFRAQTSLLAAKAQTLLTGGDIESSALDAAVVANALTSNGDYSVATRLLIKSVSTAKNPGEYVVILRMLGNYGFYQDDVAAGDKYFDLTQHVYELFPDTGQSSMEMNYAKAENEMYWAAAAAPRHCDLARKHLQQSDAYLSDATAIVKTSLNFMKQQIAQNCP